MAMSEEEKKASSKASHAKYYAKNKEKIAAQTAESMATDPERKNRRQEYLRKYAEENSAKANARTKKWREENKEKDAENKRRYSKENPEKIAAAGHRYYEANKKEIGERGRRSVLQKKYGLTPEEYEEMVVKQDGVCAICGLANHNGRRLVIDHDHDSEAVRALLCDFCNLGIGNLRESVENLKAAIAYLEIHKRGD